jgi:hypothetical protein
VTKAVKENIPGIVNVSAFAAAEARIARADAPASKKAFVDLIIALTPPLPSGLSAKRSGRDGIADHRHSQITPA